ncbi:acyl-CoA dehydrogenase family protein [Oceanicoccus sp. KOV_DT_Chl]|uniref:acyl-CoA dehydrogenase family protein n=1 Tax=Oceanicoccus sp. KOV_DT_Chl TaxID=1904639 RepID=UPI000C79E546|nr:acyl-CoA dehydrogenase family protein [Oceanicoccus sp. KOV_DT_Chl]
MDALETFRIETRAWLEANCPQSMRSPASSKEQVWAGRNKTFPSQDAKDWLERMADKGWTCPEWPSQYGGGGLSPEQGKILTEEMKAINARKPLFDLGIWMLGPALLEYGSEEQKQEHIPKIVRGDIRWAQGYSEPGSGSDLASLKTKAEDMGDHFLVNGTKLWTTNAEKCDWIFCLVRTDPDAIKQQGISFLLIDMETEGVTASPYALISGESEFCETVFDNVKVPKKNLVAEINTGWSVAKALLKHERKLMSEMGDAPSVSFSPAQAAIDYVGLGADGKLKDAALRTQLVEHEMRFRAVGLTHFRSFEERINGISDSNVPMIMKYVGTEEQKNKEELYVALLGARGIGWDENFSDDERLATRNMLFSKALSIAGGTSEVQLNIIAKRVLGLPDA